MCMMRLTGIGDIEANWGKVGFVEIRNGDGGSNPLDPDETLRTSERVS